MEMIISNLDQIGVILAAVVAVASAVSGLIRAVANITPNDADDEFASKFARFVGKMQKVLDRLALNPDQKKARKGKV